MIILLGSLFILLLIGVPIGYSLGLSSFAYFVIVHPELIAILPQRMYSGMNSYPMIALPLFVLMGLLMNSGGITSKLIDFSLLFVGRLRGGLGLVNVLASMIFGGISGSSVSDTASVGAILIPEMEKKGYPKTFATGITVASSTMGMIIPPSVPMVIYAVASGESVGKLFLGSLIPGVMIGTFMLVITFIISYKNNYPKEHIEMTFWEKVDRIRKSILALIMPIIVIGSVTAGIATATESAGIGVLYAFIVGFFIFRGVQLVDPFKSFHKPKNAIDPFKMTGSAVIAMFKNLLNRIKTGAIITKNEGPELVRSAIGTSANVMIVIAFSSLYIWILAIERIPESVANIMLGLNLPIFVILLLLNVIILLTGTFVDVTPAILLLTPVFQPALETMGVSPIQFGVILISALAVGLVTPPVGMCLNVASTISKLDIIKIFKSAVPFLIANLMTLILISLIPALCTWLPELLIKK